MTHSPGGPSFAPRVSMYDAQAQNRWRTVLLIAVFTLIVVAVERWTGWP